MLGLIINGAAVGERVVVINVGSNVIGDAMRVEGERSGEGSRVLGESVGVKVVGDAVGVNVIGSEVGINVVG